MNTTNTVNINNYFQTLRNFNERCRMDKRLAPAVQLLYRVLLDTANRNYWSVDFVVTDNYLIEVTHLAKQTITDAKCLLKNLGYIDFHGKPSKYTIYTLVDQPVGQRAGDRATPQTPRFNTLNTLNTIHTCINNDYNLRSDARDDNATANPHNDSLQPTSGTAAATDDTTSTDAAKARLEAARKRLRASAGL